MKNMIWFKVYLHKLWWQLMSLDLKVSLFLFNKSHYTITNFSDSVTRKVARRAPRALKRYFVVFINSCQKQHGLFKSELWFNYSFLSINLVFVHFRNIIFWKNLLFSTTTEDLQFCRILLVIICLSPQSIV